MTDDQFDQFIARAAKGVHEPPPTPREEIWQRIQAARRAESAVPPVEQLGAAQGARVIDIGSRRRSRAWYWSVAALAAVLLLGVMLGRLSVGRTPTELATETTSEGAPVRESAKRVETVMRFAAVEHFSQVEALLTDYELGTAGDEFQADAKDLLSRTRLLLDSKRLRDPRLRTLLEDLELVLAQIARRSASSGEERQLIEDSITERRVRSRLRNAIPAGPTA